MPKGRFWMGKCESGETSMNDFCSINGRGDCTAIARWVSFTRRGRFSVNCPYLTGIRVAQIFAGLIEAATAKRYNESPPILQPFGIESAIRATKKNRQRTKTNPHFRLRASSRFDSYPIDARRRAPPRPAHSGNHASLFGLPLDTVAAGGEDRL